MEYLLPGVSEAPPRVKRSQDKAAPHTGIWKTDPPFAARAAVQKRICKVLLHCVRRGWSSLAGLGSRTLLIHVLLPRVAGKSLTRGYQNI